MPKVSSSATFSSSSSSSPCLEVTHLGAPPELSERAASLAAWVSPLGEDAFMRDVFRQRALCVHGGATAGGNSGRVGKLVRKSLGGLDVPRLFEATASDKVFIWVGDSTTQSRAAKSSNSSGHGRRPGVHRRPGPPPGASSSRAPADLLAAPRPLQSVELEDSAAAAALHGAGHSAYCRAPPGLEANLVASLLRGTGLGCLGASDLAAAAAPGGGGGEHALARGEVELFFGTPGHVTDWHFDFQENFTVQLSGAKRWLLGRSPVAHPLRGHTPHYARSPFH
jgi:hypothetical protein